MPDPAEIELVLIPGRRLCRRGRTTDDRGETRSPTADERLLRDRVDTLYSTGWLMTAGNLVPAICVLVMLRRVAPPAILVSWLAALLLLVLVRALVCRRYRWIAQKPHSPRRWGAFMPAAASPLA